MTDHSLAFPSTLRALAFNCSLKAVGKPSSTGAMLRDVAAAFAAHGVETETVHAAAHNILPGTRSDEGPGDDWPALRAKVMAADIVVIGSPIWIGQPSSVAKRVLERMDAFIAETGKDRRMPSYGKVGAAAVVGNEDGAHHVGAEVYQALNDLGFSLAPNAMAYWVGEARGSGEYRDLHPVPSSTDDATRMMVRNAVHLAKLLRQAPYPPKP
ncbi:flavodoxin family protein [Variovorax sp. 770b2]|uniref:flavodoxin family protein n=1 Tax=Variovorax sp. 770b2 TaxID=1566271 RepID=UPI0008EB6B4E|nr:NAD(P)H-dependent oxidoreductase [Variovorax sp. 770b2]SFP38241.1 Multimeric flavodoxin WrbA [Variovorax sp. 770b2]